MTIPEFLERLKQTEGPWVLVKGRIRSTFHCPLTSLVDECEDAYEWETASDVLEMGSKDAADIVEAADTQFPGDSYVRRLRNQLLAATVNRS